jgi:hypothetical protein
MRMLRAGLLVLLTLAAGCGSARPPASGPIASTPSLPFGSPSPSPSVRIHVPPIPDGIYETTVTRSDAKRFGVFQCGPQDVDENTGHIKLMLQAGRFRWDITANHPIFSPSFTGVYTGSTTRVTFLFDSNTAGEGADTVRWSFDGTYLRFKVLSALPEDAAGSHLCVARMQYEAHPWRKTG